MVGMIKSEVTKQPTASKPIVTIDLEDWFHLLDCDAIPGPSGWDQLESRIEHNTDRLLELLARLGIQATFFSLGWVATRYPALLQKIVNAGHEVGCHSGFHTLIHQQTPEAFRDETAQAMAHLSSCIGRPITAYRAPGFSLTGETLWAFDILADLGVTTDCSVFSGRHSHGGTADRFPSGPFAIQCRNGKVLKELPMTLASLGPVQVAFAGGGYFRLFPYSMIARWTRLNPYTMTYFHPRDFDAEQPRIKGLSALRSFKAYAGIGGAFQKLERFLTDFGGQSLSQAEVRVEWHTKPVIRL